MALVRCYLPFTAAQLTALHEEREVAGQLAGHAVTRAVRQSDPSGDLDAWEWAALQDAARACRDGGGPVIVAAVDVERDQIDDAREAGSGVRVRGPVRLPRVASLHVGDDVLEPDAAAEPEDDDGTIELSWYDTTELAALVSLAGGTEAPRDEIEEHRR